MNEYCNIFKEIKHIAVVGISDKPYRDSLKIANFLKGKGYYIYGVHPQLKEVDGITVYKKLFEIPGQIDLVDVFVNSKRIEEIIQDLILCKPKYVWFQLGIKNDSAVAALENEGIKVIEGKCIKIEYQRCFN
jgi:predicted CoA-binding protein